MAPHRSNLVNPVITSFTSSADPDNLSSPLSPADLRRRSIPHHILDAQTKHAMTTDAEPKILVAEGVNVVDSEQSSTIEPIAVAHLTVWQKYFCKPVVRNGEKPSGPEDLKFSILSKGFIVCLLASMIALATILGPVLAIYTTRHSDDHPHPPMLAPASPGVPFNKTIAGPVNNAIAFNYPDPVVVHTNGTWYALATNNAIGMVGMPANYSFPNMDWSDNVQIASSTDFMNWTVLDSTYNILPNVGAWAVQVPISKGPPFSAGPGVWAPAIFQRPSDGKWVLYYAAKDATVKTIHCVGAAVSSNGIFGPYDPIDSVFACPAAVGGAIDPASYIDDDDTIWIAYKIDGNNKGNGGECGNTEAPIKNTPIMLQKVDTDGVTPVGDPINILNRTAADGPLVEAPAIVKVNGTYFLFFSSGCTRDPSYTVKYAWSSSIEGPYTRADQDLLKSGDWSLSAPGSCSVAQDSDGNWGIAFHARVSTAYGGAREMFTAGLRFNGTEVSVVDFGSST